MKFIITGANGFIGSELCRTLEQKNHKFHAIRNKEILHTDYFDSIDSSDGDVVIHLANKSFVPESWEKIEDYLNVNLIGTLKVLEYCKLNKLGLVYISSYMYGNPDYFPIDEKHKVKTNNPYALSKKMCEELIQFYANNFGTKYNIIRPFNIYGKGQKDSYIIPIIINQLKDKNIKEIILNDLNPKRDFIHVKDVVEALICCSTDLRNQIYNVSSGKSVSIQEIGLDLIKLSGEEKELRSRTASRRNEINDCFGDNTKIFNDFGWSPKVELREGLRDCLKNN